MSQIGTIQWHPLKSSEKWYVGTKGADLELCLETASVKLGLGLETRKLLKLIKKNHRSRISKTKAHRSDYKEK